MFTFLVLAAIWLFLMLRSSIAEYKYYQAVKTLQPDVWEQLGSPRFLKIPLVFLSSEGLRLLQGISNEKICLLAKKNKQVRFQFLSYVILVIGFSIVYFKTNL
ncbi:MAG: hypothetical protein ACI9MS_001266 [Glaciecola sp.]|jgi:hypothetical protein